MFFWEVITPYFKINHYSQPHMTGGQTFIRHIYTKLLWNGWYFDETSLRLPPWSLTCCHRPVSQYPFIILKGWDGLSWNCSKWSPQELELQWWLCIRQCKVQSDFCRLTKIVKVMSHFEQQELGFEGWIYFFCLFVIQVMDCKLL